MPVPTTSVRIHMERECTHNLEEKSSGETESLVDLESSVELRVCENH